jgi:2-methylcitrate dehydratase PrpD
VHIEVRLRNGETLELFVEESLGNLRRPLSDEQLEEKFRDQAVLALPAERVEELVANCRRIDALEDIGVLCRAAVPPAGTVRRSAAAANAEPA